MNALIIRRRRNGKGRRTGSAAFCLSAGQSFRLSFSALAGVKVSLREAAI